MGSRAEGRPLRRPAFGLYAVLVLLCCITWPAVITPAGVTAHALHLLGDIATHPDWFDPDSGEAYYRRARTLAEPRGMRPLVAHCYLSHGKLYRCAGRRGEAQGHLTIATTMYREMGMTYWLEKAEAAGEDMA